MRMHPDETARPIVCGSLEPWMRYSVPLRYMARAPSGFSGPPRMEAGQIGAPAAHLGGRCPRRPFALHRDFCGAGPFKTGAADAYAIFNRLVSRQNKIKTAFFRRDDNRSRRVGAIVGDKLARRSGGTRADFHVRERPPGHLRISIGLNIGGAHGARYKQKQGSAPSRGKIMTGHTCSWAAKKLALSESEERCCFNQAAATFWQ